MSKLYFLAAGEARGWQVPGQQGKGAQRVDVPNSPEALAAWLNERHVPAVAIAELGAPGTADAAELEPEEREELETQLSGAPGGPRIPGFCDACGRSAAGTLKLQQGNELDAIEQWAETAEVWALKRLADRIGEIARQRSVAIGVAHGRAN